MVVLLGTLALACAPSRPEPPTAMTIGVHDVALHVPDGWLRFDHGREQRFQREIAQITLADFGPVTPEGYLREIEHARELFRGRQLADSRTQLSGLRMRSAFSTERQWKRFESSWVSIADVGRRDDTVPEEVEYAYSEVLRQIGALPAPTLSEIVERALPHVGHGAQRDVAEQSPVTIDGRQGLRVETWDRLSHDHRQSYLFVLNEGNLVVARMELGKFAVMTDAFEAIVESLEIHPRPNDATPIQSAGSGTS